MYHLLIICLEKTELFSSESFVEIKRHLASSVEKYGAFLMQVFFFTGSRLRITQSNGARLTTAIEDADGKLHPVFNRAMSNEIADDGFLFAEGNIVDTGPGTLAQDSWVDLLNTQ